MPRGAGAADSSNGRQCINARGFAYGLQDRSRRCAAHPGMGGTAAYRDGSSKAGWQDFAAAGFELEVAGQTPEAVQQTLTEQLIKFVRKPRVTVTVQEIHSRIQRGQFSGTDGTRPRGVSAQRLCCHSTRVPPGRLTLES